MDFKNIDIEKIFLKKSVKNSYDILFNDKYLEINTPKLFIPFGLERKYNDYFLNFQFIDYKKNINLEIFFNFINNFEKRLRELLNIDFNNFNSQIRINSNYDPIIYTKLIYKNHFITEAFKNNENLNIFNLEKGVYANCVFLIDKIWFKNNKFYYKIKVKKIFVL